MKGYYIKEAHLSWQIGQYVAMGFNCPKEMPPLEMIIEALERG